MTDLVSYVLCQGSGWRDLPTLSRVERKTADEVVRENDMARQLQMERYWITLDEARRRFPNNAIVVQATARQ